MKFLKKIEFNKTASRSIIKFKPAVLMVAAQIILLVSSLSLRAVAEDNDYLFKPVLYSLDNGTSKQLESYLSRQTSTPYLHLSGYEYSVSEGWILDDLGFIPNYYQIPPKPKKISFDHLGLKTCRDICQKEISKIHHLVKEKIDEGYQSNIQNEIIKTVQKVENELPIEHSSFGVVHDQRTGKIVAVLRSYEAFINGQGQVVLPSFEILRQRNLLSSDEEARLLQTIGGTHGSKTKNVMIEVGQFYVDATLSPTERLEVKRQLWAWFTAMVIDSAKNEKIIVAHVSKNILARKYKQEYGFDNTIIERTFTEGDTAITEKVMTVSSTVMREKLLHIIAQGSVKTCRSLFHQ